ncbi:MAG: helix-turn-helix domain-containing protein [Rhodospirillales bacterium]|nr:helix-turn-helix domain-containing protein [Rhodospirillales bacterium]MCW8862312.1 helix-turn-helix domain-containing protein [Rhodospirillales bacterium]MCW8951593.1 helix-turn-helix domain-containing protein [Rhodospirillales bacterium]MCW8970522.1 helix-turn-helix domain-containing protein [Rhodospirillales bacterium]MCW9002596.1 helix-turn-helix domain-containing protein [Rhodospirillales bacterium]
MTPFDHAAARWKQTHADGFCAACDVRRLTFCDGIPDDSLEDLHAAMRPVLTEKGRPLIREGEEATALFNVTAGTVKLYKLMADGRRQIIGFLGEGSLLGLGRNGAYVYSAEAVTQVSSCRYNVADVEKLMERFPSARKKMVDILSQELVAVEEHTLLLGRKSAVEKVASFLLALSDGAVLRGHPEFELSIPMGRLDIGDYLGLTIETVSRTISQFKRDNLIAVPSNSRIRILDKKRLASIAEGV